jgi:hypothetical protein
MMLVMMVMVMVMVMMLPPPVGVVMMVMVMVMVMMMMMMFIIVNQLHVGISTISRRHSFCRTSGVNNSQKSLGVGNWVEKLGIRFGILNVIYVGGGRRGCCLTGRQG